MNISMLRIVHLCLRFSIPMSELLRHQFYNFSVISFNRVSTVIGRSDKDAAHKFWLVWLCPSLIKLMQWKLMIQTNTGTHDKTFLSSLSTVTEKSTSRSWQHFTFFFWFWGRYDHLSLYSSSTVICTISIYFELEVRILHIGACNIYCLLLSGSL